ncbi:MAG: NAD(P)H-hydrate dehydratase [Proteobacteria bacterium]|nr:NAD(P)H-hydrate dehydratase [Pseudomonadota bacterium]
MFLPAPPIYSVAAIREIEQKLIPSAKPPLMERAGRAAAEDAVRLTIDRPGPILFACGPGNNGGDGFVMARQLRQAGREVVVAFADDPAGLPTDAGKAHADFIHAGGTITPELPPTPANGWALVVDALFGIGLKRGIEGRYAEWIARLNAHPVVRMALDVPSGLDADTGHPTGPCFRATHTTTFIALKPGLLTNDGPDYCGEISVQSLDIDCPACLDPRGFVVSPALFAACLVPRPRNTHKGRYGDVGILGGDGGMAGAALLAGRAALILGAGRVYVGLMDRQAPTVDVLHPELMLRSATHLPRQLGALALGPGLGKSEAARAELSAAIRSDAALVLDADALNLLAADSSLHAAVAGRSAATVLTPHPAEAARLLARHTAEVQADRLGAALEIASNFNACIVLKGCGSVIATPERRWYINGTGHPGMATAGMGDVLTGLVASLIAQGWAAEQALIAAVHLHGAAADLLANEGIGPIGLAAGEVIGAARRVFNDWLKTAAPMR